MLFDSNPKTGSSLILKLELKCVMAYSEIEVFLLKNVCYFVCIFLDDDIIIVVVLAVVLCFFS